MTQPVHIPKCGIAEPLDAHDHLDLDSRGIIKIFEPPSPKHVYAIGVDPTVGITGWSRELRTSDDYRTDNGSIEVIRVGTPDVQVAEYAAPIDPEDLADVVNLLGRWYAGRDESGQCLCNIEVYPGPGLLTQRKLINEYHYYHLFVWKYLDTLTSKPTNSFGWTSTPKSVRDLWIRSSRHIKRGGIQLNSPWLLEEMRNCAMRPDMMWGESVGGKHDDRLRALMLAIWCAHDWSNQIDLGDQQGVEPPRAPNWQASAMTVAQMHSEWEDAWERLSEAHD